jgi:uncharacterized protein (DUF1810 family)
MPELARFRIAQDQIDSGFDAALAELRAGRKRGHWVWYVFPQLAGLGASSMSRAYAIRDAAEAEDYLRDPILCSRLVAITTVVADELSRGVPSDALMGSSLDAQKLVSSLTLFEAVARRLYASGGLQVFGTLASLADRVLDMAERDGISRCRFTLAQLAAAARRPV